MLNVSLYDVITNDYHENNLTLTRQSLLALGALNVDYVTYTLAMMSLL